MNSIGKLLLARGRSIKPGELVPSPCMSVCRMDAVTGLCEGCFRTLDEIAVWSGLGDEDKRKIWKIIEQRALA
jgi:predicted Fe-S protein YdhL (DUF1289 family)